MILVGVAGNTVLAVQGHLFYALRHCLVWIPHDTKGKPSMHDKDPNNSLHLFSGNRYSNPLRIIRKCSFHFHGLFIDLRFNLAPSLGVISLTLRGRADLALQGDGIPGLCLYIQAVGRCAAEKPFLLCRPGGKQSAWVFCYELVSPEQK